MVALSMEMNRLLGLLLLDPQLQAQFFGDTRAETLRGFRLSGREYALLMDSQARTLAELASDICAGMAEGTEKRPAWLTPGGEVDLRSFRNQALPDAVSARGPAFQRPLNELTTQLAGVRTEQEWHAA